MHNDLLGSREECAFFMLGIGDICKKRSDERIGGTVDWQFYGQEQERRTSTQIKHESRRCHTTLLPIRLDR
jgi:hypothetical protein